MLWICLATPAISCEQSFKFSNNLISNLDDILKLYTLSPKTDKDPKN